ncbi:hypothetical protein EBB79_21870 (plasmid) [Parasedimentitalea marina]|uniref:Uncharacterized protein n=1 Tax=Parasedimentitalea marina TaxID=2483033 RepID=A0A3T0N9B6_9RHOB|nr:hypothetical protein [Parasedimentitalea marina]AZV80618.1 hypothetical protein EBB79_21870 [Parasedimentitalea marina]
MRSAQAVFVFNLLQDVNILRGLVYLARQETEASLCFLVTKGFVKRDSRVIWQKELAAMVRDTGAEIHLISESADVWTALQGGGGILISASESDLPEHRETSAIMRATPSSFLKVTLQHGLECVGFRQSREHNIRHGRDVGFNADVVCSWLAPHRLSATRASERAKIIVTGPPTLLQRRRTHPDHPPLTQALVCENMHSARLQATGDHKASFMETFFDFCRRQPTGEGVTLRPHPGGQYVLKNNIALPENVALNNLPIYDVNLPGYGYGISAPSTVVFDMVLAGLPVGVWRDPDGIMDIGNYAGLAQISAVDDWLNFAQECRHNHAALVARQNAFLERQGVLMDPNEIYRRFTALLRNALAQFRPPHRFRPQPRLLPFRRRPGAYRLQRHSASCSLPMTRLPPFNSLSSNRCSPGLIRARCSMTSSPKQR